MPVVDTACRTLDPHAHREQPDGDDSVEPEMVCRRGNDEDRQDRVHHTQPAPTAITDVYRRPPDQDGPGGMHGQHRRQLIRGESQAVHRLAVLGGGVGESGEQSSRRDGDQLHEKAGQRDQDEGQPDPPVVLTVTKKEPYQENEQPGEVHRRVVTRLQAWTRIELCWTSRWTLASEGRWMSCYRPSWPPTKHGA